MTTRPCSRNWKRSPMALECENALTQQTSTSLLHRSSSLGALLVQEPWRPPRPAREGRYVRRRRTPPRRTRPALPRRARRSCGRRCTRPARRAHPPDRLSNVLRLETADEVHRYIHRLADGAADLPVVHTARAAQFLHRQRGVATIEQDRIDVRRDRQRLVARPRAGDVDHLDNADAWQRPT